METRPRATTKARPAVMPPRAQRGTAAQRPPQHGQRRGAGDGLDPSEILGAHVGGGTICGQCGTEPRRRPASGRVGQVRVIRVLRVDDRHPLTTGARGASVDRS